MTEIILIKTEKTCLPLSKQ